jgi:hypothetical protein
VDGERELGGGLTLAEVLDVAEAILIDQIRERTLIERQVIGARAAMHAEEFDPDELPDVDKALELFAQALNADADDDEALTPEDELRLAVGLGKRRT